MRTKGISRFSALLALFAVAACDDVVVDPAFDEMAPAEVAELAVLADQESFDIAVDMSMIANDVAMERGRPGASEGRTLNAEARAAFAEARAAWLAGDHRRALDASRAARRLVARALIATGGVPAVDDLIERLEDILLTMDGEVFDDPEALRAELEAIIAEARALLDAGDSVGAAARALLGEQRVRLRRGPHLRDFRVSADRARFEVALARTAVALAERLLRDDVITDEQVGAATRTNDAPETDVRDHRNRWLMHARKWLERAEIALENGHFARAVHAAHHAQWSALKAVILPGGITEEEIREILGLARELHEQAEAALGDDPTDFELRVFNRAGDLIEIGVRRLEAGQKRGVAALWRSSLMSRWLIG